MPKSWKSKPAILMLIWPTAVIATPTLMSIMIPRVLNFSASVRSRTATKNTATGISALSIWMKATEMYRNALFPIFDGPFTE